MHQLGSIRTAQGEHCLCGSTHSHTLQHRRPEWTSLQQAHTPTQAAQSRHRHCRHHSRARQWLAPVRAAAATVPQADSPGADQAPLEELKVGSAHGPAASRDSHACNRYIGMVTRRSSWTACTASTGVSQQTQSCALRSASSSPAWRPGTPHRRPTMYAAVCSQALVLDFRC